LTRFLQKQLFSIYLSIIINKQGFKGSLKLNVQGHNYKQKDHQTMQTYLHMHISIMLNNLGLSGISKPYKVLIITILNMTMLGYVRKFRPKRFHQIGSSILTEPANPPPQHQT
jgi:hypothetical protein